MRSSLVGAGIAALGAMLAGSAAARAATFDLAGQFGATNPSGPWSYGYVTTSGTVLFPSYAGSAASFESWTDPSLPQTSVYETPSDARNGSGADITSGTVVLRAGQASFHPGQGGEVAFYDFTSPTAATYAVSAVFDGRDYVGPTDTQASISTGGTTVFQGVVDGFGGGGGRSAFGSSPTISYGGDVTLAAGQSLLFEVAFDPAGSRGTGPFFYDTTGVGATLTTVTSAPEPSALALTAAGLVVLGLSRRRPAGAG